MTPTLSAARDLACGALLTSAAAGLLLCTLAEAATRSGALRAARTRAVVWMAALALTAATAPLAALAEWFGPGTIAEARLSAPPASTPSLRPPGDGLRLPPRVLDALALAWLAGAVVGAVRVAAGVRRARRLKHAAAPLDDPTLSRVRAEAGPFARPLEVRVSAEVATPVLVGYRNPAVILPAKTGLTPRELRWVLLHECAHARRCDDVALLGEALLRALLWPSPAVHWAAAGVAFERELACDEWSLARSGAPRRAYARTLVRTASLAIGAPMPLAAPGFGQRTGLARRVDALLRGAARRRPLALVFCGALLTAAGVALALVPTAPLRVRGAGSAERATPLSGAAADCVIPLASLPDPGPGGVVAVDPSAAQPAREGVRCDPATVRATVIPAAAAARAVE